MNLSPELWSHLQSPMAGRAAGEEGGRSGGGAGGGGGGRGAPAAELGAHSCILPQGSVLQCLVIKSRFPFLSRSDHFETSLASGVVKETKASEEAGARPPGEERARKRKAGEQEAPARPAVGAGGGRWAGEQEARRPGKVVRLLESETGNQLPAVLASSILANGQS